MTQARPITEPGYTAVPFTRDLLLNSTCEAACIEHSYKYTGNYVTDMANRERKTVTLNN